MEKFLTFIIVAVFSILLVACNDSEETDASVGGEGSSNEPQVTVVLKTLSSQYWKFVEAGARQAFEDFGVDGTILGPSAEDRIIEQVNMMEDTLSKDPDAFVVAASQPDTAIPVLQKFQESKIPVLLIDTYIEWEGKTAFIGTENYEAGQKGGEFLASLLNEGDEVALLRGSLGNPATDERIQGAKDYLEENGFVIVADQPAESDRNKAMSVMENILQTNPEVKGVYSANDDMALGALRSLSAEGLEIPVVGTDGTIEAVESIVDGGLAGSVAQSPFDMGYKGVEEALKAINDESVEVRIDSGVDIISAHNAEEKLYELEDMLE